ncbi:LysR family transcriptional regulator [Acetobacterium wieringae]|uniref:LysR family transcriptional regulator n=2 Tax=Acetobacterium wieringae TaxID=52694 RepID=A0A5D0WHK9_9FIRM|nr:MULTISPECIES: LysR family transcriptional regulator [Acetobacterium]TYC83735.1 LysR family transcriptional regulator [Acetobacterium wieringae]UYO62719.1 LysR family transcriptional regulator [Acetobacterium wieringae]
MDLKQLKTFVVLSKNKNYTRTADELGYAQSSISAQIQQLEQELNTKCDISFVIKHFHRIIEWL